ncbi:uncharacterized protein Tco025E_08697 [Trypanosoma conorhini]|uniref:Uncharacterized protein n=1 Tax=Trypanosoma conorhini TaxID=83891 RepID=A0A3R7RED1_9TRYP|nr:uncharacterized protein Tco025E_08697 [Trypanosoma conorhini]RNF00952.1 hypothetical protein Tco025E_08697 [Trypanosoma conorhini]
MRQSSASSSSHRCGASPTGALWGVCCLAILSFHKSILDSNFVDSAPTTGRADSPPSPSPALICAVELEARSIVNEAQKKHSVRRRCTFPHLLGRPSHHLYSSTFRPLSPSGRDLRSWPASRTAGSEAHRVESVIYLIAPAAPSAPDVERNFTALWPLNVSSTAAAVPKPPWILHYARQKWPFVKKKLKQATRRDIRECSPKTVFPEHATGAGANEQRTSSDGTAHTCGT